jgi:hypothetical protein
LLYRLKKLGAPLAMKHDDVWLPAAFVTSPMQRMSALDPEDRAQLEAQDLKVLPSYSPQVSPSFADWLDGERSAIDLQIRNLLLSDLRQLHLSHSWTYLARLSEVLMSLDFNNEEVVRARVEALALLGRKSEALSILDSYVTDTDDVGRNEPLRRLRSQVVRSPMTRYSAKLHGRAAAMAFIEDEWSKVGTGGGRQAVIVGPAGLGKTRLAEDFSARVLLSHERVIRYGCDEQSRSRPLALFSDILPELRAMRGSIGAAPSYRPVLALVRPPSDASDTSAARTPLALGRDALRLEIQHGLVDLIEAVSEEGRVLLLIDDAHLLDEASCTVLHALSARTNSAAILILACVRPGHHESALLIQGSRNSVHSLHPLSLAESKRLLLELPAAAQLTDLQIEWCLKQANGNPFYLQALAARGSAGSAGVPFDIRTLASTSYYSLRPASRAVLEVCLLLDTHASIHRVVAIAGVEDNALLPSLRELEERDLVHFEQGILRGPHALLLEALRDLLPTSVKALLHHRIAAFLERECVADQYASALAWASAQSWLAAGEPESATRLIRKCAQRAVALGEPAVAAELLWQVTRADLPHSLCKELLDDLIRYAEAGGCRQIAVSALHHRLSLAEDLEEGRHDVQGLQLRLIEAELLNGSQLVAAVPRLTSLLADESASSQVRARAAARLMVIADVELDRELAERVRAELPCLIKSEETAPTLQRAQLVYHTSFGDPVIAHQLAMDLLARFPRAEASEISSSARSFAAFAFHRLRDAHRASLIAEESFAFVSERGALSEALYFASLRTDVAITEGDFEAARLWLDKSDEVARGGLPSKLSPNSGYYANAGVLSMREGRYAEAEEFFRFPLREYSILAAARYRAISIAISLRLRQLSGQEIADGETVGLLAQLYDKGRNMGGQDTIVETLWCAYVMSGEEQTASELLRDYLATHRRERSLPEWSLRHTTAADMAWQAYTLQSDFSA